jgi:hypothetical protein
MLLQKVVGLTKKTKIAYLIIIMAITIVAVAFLFKAKLDEVEKTSTHSHNHEHETHAGHDDLSNVDHLIKKSPTEKKVIRIGATGAILKDQEKWTLPVFTSYVEDTYKSLPNLEAARGLKDEEVHRNPKLVMDAGLRLGSIKKQIKLNIEFEEEGMKFYDKCAQKEDGLTPVRALCLANLVYMKNQKGEDFKLDKYPKKVRELAKKALELSF